jgi:quercetin dioxygenase-like cupin family protein
VSVDELLGLDPSRSTPAPLRRSTSVIQRASQNPVIEMENGVRWEKLATDAEGPADVLLVSYQPGASSSVEGRLMRHAGLEYAYMLEGTITLQLEFETYEVNAGDSLHFDSTRPHLFSNQGDVPAVGVWFIIGRHDAPVSSPRSAARPGSPPARSAVDVLQRLDFLDALDG